MNTDELSKFYNIMNDDGIYLSYQGPLWQELLEELNDLVRSKLKKNDEAGSCSKYLTLFVELVQNIVRYSSKKTKAPDGTETSHGIVITGSNNDMNYILVGNYIDSYHRQILHKVLKGINGKSRDELTALFKKQLRGDVHEKAFGAGLGLIDIYRRADKVTYNFSETEKKQDFFSIKVEFAGT